MGHHTPSRTPRPPRPTRKRAIAATAATGALLIAGATAGAAALTGNDTGPEAAATMAIPPAQTAGPPTPDTSTAPADQQQQNTDDAREQALNNASQTLSGSAAHPPEEDEEEPEPQPTDTSSDLTPTGDGGACQASMYSEPQPTASGEQFDPSAMTAAHKTLPMDTMVQVTNPANNKSVTVRINDRGPYIDGRCLDLSTASFEKIASPSQGVVDVQWQVVN
ncbi:MAG: septal ring lytic transglycosylase RlpA family protein [Nocardiopsaceae bacterium]|nr:septal ring lytic transglycosylase RlpA family protein [Nocardiopsaceae bacterium]